jgi:LPS-assembly lipoprotein
LSRVAAACACVALAACGFQLRGEVSTGYRSLYLVTEAPSQVATEIRRQLAGSPTHIAANAGDGEVHVRILSESTEKTIHTLTGAGRVFEYQLRLRVGYQVTVPPETPLVAPTEIELRRLIGYSESAPLAKETEERLLFEDMRAEAATRILRQIAVARGRTAP